MYILIIGCGKLGSCLANLLSKEGEDVVIVDKKAEAFEELNAEFSGFQLVGDAAEMDVLEKAKIKNVDVLVAVTEDDNVNMMVAQIAKEIYHVPKVLARILDSSREKICRDHHIETLCPTVMSAVKLKEMILG